MNTFRWRIRWRGMGRVGAVFLWLATGAVSTPAAVRLNEVMAHNATLAVTNGGTPDWIELYNPGSMAEDVAGMSLSHTPTNSGQFVFPSNSMVPAGGYLVVYAGGGAPPEALNTGFGLSADGAALYLFNAAGNLVDSVGFGLQAADYSIGRVGDDWRLTRPTPGATNLSVALGNIGALRINEWMAKPVSGDDWFEVYNPEPLPVDVSLCFFTDLVQPNNFRLPALSFLGVGEYAFQKFIADGTTTNGASHVNLRLSAKGDGLGFFTSSGARIDAVNFGAQLQGVSQGRLPDGAGTFVIFDTTPTPGASNYRPLNNVVINEILSHTDPPLEDALELYNPTATDVAIGGWYLSDSTVNFKKYRIPPQTVLSAHGFAVCYEYQFGNPLSPTAFQFNSSEGDSAYLSAADEAGNLTGYRTSVKFGPMANGVSMGRWETSTGPQFVPLSLRTFGMDNPTSLEAFRWGTGASNAYPLVGPLVINEIMYHPLDLNGLDNAADEYLELHNLTANPIPLFDPADPSRTWRLRGGVDWDFPTNQVVPPGGYVLLVNFNPVADPASLDSFRSRYGVPTNVLVLGPYSGKLSNGGDSVSLEQPDPIQGLEHLNAGLVPYVRVDHIEYSDAAPWPALADGTGNALARLTAAAFGNDPTNWSAAAPTPGRNNLGAAVDSDHDGMPDDWELAHRLNPESASDATQDADGDGRSNLDEFRSGTDPQDARSVLRVAIKRGLAQGVVVQFQAEAGHSYTLQAREAAGRGTWSKVYDVDADAAVRQIEWSEGSVAGPSQRLYRVVTPRQ